MSITESDRQAFRQQVSAYAKTLSLPGVVGIINDMVDRQLYEQAAQEEQRALALIAEMWGIIRELAEADTYSYNDNNDKMECQFCTDSYGFGPRQKHTPTHTQHCLVTRARKLVEGGK